MRLRQDTDTDIDDDTHSPDEPEPEAYKHPEAQNGHIDVPSAHNLGQGTSGVEPKSTSDNYNEKYKVLPISQRIYWIIVETREDEDIKSYTFEPGKKIDMREKFDSAEPFASIT